MTQQQTIEFANNLESIPVGEVAYISALSNEYGPLFNYLLKKIDNQGKAEINDNGVTLSEADISLEELTYGSDLYKRKVPTSVPFSSPMSYTFSSVEDPGNAVDKYEIHIGQEKVKKALKENGLQDFIDYVSVFNEKA